MAYPVTAEIDTYGALSDGQDSMGLQVHPPPKKVRPLFQIKSLTPLLYFFRGKYSWTPQLEQFLVSPPHGDSVGGVKIGPTPPYGSPQAAFS